MFPEAYTVSAQKGETKNSQEQKGLGVRRRGYSSCLLTSKVVSLSVGECVCLCFVCVSLCVLCLLVCLYVCICVHVWCVCIMIVCMCVVYVCVYLYVCECMCVLFGSVCVCHVVCVLCLCVCVCVVCMCVCCIIERAVSKTSVELCTLCALPQTHYLILGCYAYIMLP